MLTIYVALTIAIVAIALVGPKRALGQLRNLRLLTTEARIIIIASAIVAVTLVVLALPYTNLRAYLVYLAASTVCFASLLLLLARFDRLAEAISRVIERTNVWVFAVLFAVFAALAALMILKDIPHITDEVAYQFQARALAQGRLFFDMPPAKDFFIFTHIIMDGEKWYGILNPGWPAVLALGYLVNAPWLVNPLLGALTLIVLFSFYKAAGYSLLESKLAVLLLAISPFVLFMSANYMSHAANLFLFALFLLAYVKMYLSGKPGYAVMAGLALGINVLVRPTDSMVAAAPFLIHLLLRAAKDRRFMLHVGVIAVLASTFIALTFLYNSQLTGQPLEFPMTKYFKDGNLGKFGIGFGADMGTKLHGPEWPGFYPSDAIRVSSYRLSELLQDFQGLPLLLIAACLLAVARWQRWRGEWNILLLSSALLLLGVYGLHFYHGIAFGSRHYYLALPALALLVARPLNWSISEGDQPPGRLGRVALAALLIHTIIFPYPELIRRYGSQYRWISTAVRDTVADSKVSNAVVFVDENEWGWKSAFPLNSFPIERNSVIFARDLGEQNQLLVDLFPDRAFYYIKLKKGGRGAEFGPLSLKSIQEGNSASKGAGAAGEQWRDN